jgi:NADPH-dependent 2,4-dienoyl-CoA reductase/sulfur reductase-like enzyme
MADRNYDVVVVGAGPAGLAAACRAAECGRRVALVDDNPLAGGQIWRAAGGKPPSEALRWARAAERHGVEWIAGARVFDAPEPQRLAVETFDEDWRVGYGRLILATGARERFLPFPGWTLPNVTGAGGLQALAKSGLPIAGKRIVIAGSGPLLLAVARYLRAHGADIRVIAEQAEQAALLRFGLRLAGHPAKLLQALKLRAGLTGIRYATSCWPVSAQGGERLESVTLRRGDGSTRTESCDYLACGFGLIPNVELAALLGCRISQAAVEVDEHQETSQAGVFAAGEATGLGGLELSLVEGEIAGYAAGGNPERARALLGARASHRRFAAALREAFALRPELRSLPLPGTLVCRCEDVALERVRACANWREAKLHTRCGMGPCQGRICGGALEFLLGWQNESVRPPVLPARVRSMSR